MIRRPPLFLIRLVHSATLPAILLLAVALNGFELGRLSLWYDEVVTMRLARAETPSGMLRLLGEIDATRAPLHPLVLRAWISVFGASDLAGRSFSALCGVATVFLVFWIGRSVDGRSTGLWAAWLATLSPALIQYSREARMYAWLVLVTCACWALLLSRPRNGASEKDDELTMPELISETPAIAPCRSNSASGVYILCLVALAYSHPLGLIMAMTLAVASGLFARACFDSWTRWLAVHAIVALCIAPWLGHYLDHPPESVSGRLPIKFLLGTPIGFIGGNFLTLALFLTVATYGVVRKLSSESRSDAVERSRIWKALICLLSWFVIPPLTLFIYSAVAHPIFGPSRYTVFVAPAYLIFVALGLSRLPMLVRYPLALAMAGLSLSALLPLAYSPDAKADWRACAEWMARENIRSPSVIVMSADPLHNVEVETAIYYLPTDARILPFETLEASRLDATTSDSPDSRVFLAVGSRQGVPSRPVPERLGKYRVLAERSFAGLAIFQLVRGR